MIYKRFYLVIVAYVAAMLILAFVFAFSLNRDLFQAILILILIIILTVYFGVYLNRTNQKLALFFNAIRNEDTTLVFPQDIGFKNEKNLNRSLNDLNKKLGEARISIEVQEKFYRLVMDNIPIGIISYDSKGLVEFANPEFMRMFNLDHISHIGRLKTSDPKMVEMLESIEPGTRKQVNIRSGHTLMNIAVYAQLMVIRGREMKIVTMQDIKNELDNKELDSWQKLIRILNHEIMNTVAPITSLSTTLSGFYKTQGEEVSPGKVTAKMISDTVRGLSIIEEHGKGLINFAESYRSLTQLPKPEFALIDVEEFFERITILANSYLESVLQEQQVKPVISTGVEPSGMKLLADDKLLAQVLINLIRNSVEAFNKGRTDNKITVQAVQRSDSRILITVTDNGPGMDTDILEKIFIPFFTTKESGSGIGLSLSRQIISLHNGTLTCDSAPNQGTAMSIIL